MKPTAAVASTRLKATHLIIVVSGDTDRPRYGNTTSAKITTKTRPVIPWTKIPNTNCAVGVAPGARIEPLIRGQLIWGRPIPANQKPTIVAIQVAMKPATNAPPTGWSRTQLRHRTTAGGAGLRSAASATVARP